MGATGPAGGSETIPGALKAFTIYLDYSAPGAISRVYIPPGLFGPAADPRLVVGGTFIGDVGTDLVFLGLPTVTMANTAYAFAAGLSANGYIGAGNWEIVPLFNIRPQNGFLNYKFTADYAVTITTDLTSMNGANTGVYPTTGAAAGFLATVTIFYV